MAGVKGMRDKLLNSPTRAEAWRAGVRVGLIRNRLMKHILGEIEMTPTQLRAADILLTRTIPAISSVEMVGKDGGPIEFTNVDQKEVARRYAFLMSRAAIKKAQETSKEPA